MGRPLRIEYPGAFYHVTSRGNERRAIFLTQKNYERMIGYLESATERYGAQIHCFCLMSNHYHLLLETPRGNLRQILHHLNTSYTNYFNAKTGRAGHLFQGRYRATLLYSWLWTHTLIHKKVGHILYRSAWLEQRPWHRFVFILFWR